MTIILNGERTVLPERAVVADAVMELRGTLDGRGIAVALNGNVIPRAEWATTGLSEEDSIEILAAVAGG